MKIEGEGYSVEYRDADNTVVFDGTLRLGGMPEYTPILDLLNEALEKGGNTLTVDMRALQLLNSSGITMMSKFVIGCRSKNSSIKMMAAESIPWQGKSLKNLQRLLPSLELDVA